MGAYSGSQTLLLFQLLPLLLLFLLWGEVFLCFYLQPDKGAKHCVRFFFFKRTLPCFPHSFAGRCPTFCAICQIFLFVSHVKRGVSNLRVVHSEQLLRLLAVCEARLPKLSLHVQFNHYPPDVFVSLSHIKDLLQLVSVQGLKLLIKAYLDVINHIL